MNTSGISQAQQGLDSSRWKKSFIIFCSWFCLDVGTACVWVQQAIKREGMMICLLCVCEKEKLVLVRGVCGWNPYFLLFACPRCIHHNTCTNKFRKLLHILLWYHQVCTKTHYLL